MIKKQAKKCYVCTAYFYILKMEPKYSFKISIFIGINGIMPQKSELYILIYQKYNST
jgi:hypothetical protein